MRQFKRNILRTADETLYCGGSLTINGSSGYYEVPIFLGSGIGDVTITLNASNVPDRFQIIWDGNVVADSLFVGGYLGGVVPPNPSPSSFYEDSITDTTSLNKFLYNGVAFDTNGSMAVSFSASDIADSTGDIGTLRSLGSIGGQLGVVADYPNKISQTVTITTDGIPLSITVFGNTYITADAGTEAQTATAFLIQHATTLFTTYGIVLTNPSPATLVFTRLATGFPTISAVSQTVDPIDYTNVAKASDGAIKLTFNKSSALPQEMTIVSMGTTGTGWNILNIECS